MAHSSWGKYVRLLQFARGTCLPDQGPHIQPQLPCPGMEQAWLQSTHRHFLSLLIWGCGSKRDLAPACLMWEAAQVEKCADYRTAVGAGEREVLLQEGSWGLSSQKELAGATSQQGVPEGQQRPAEVSAHIPEVSCHPADMEAEVQRIQLTCQCVHAQSCLTLRPHGL